MAVKIFFIVFVLIECSCTAVSNALFSSIYNNTLFSSIYNNTVSSLYNKLNELICDKYEGCELTPEESYGCHTFSTDSLNTTCLVRDFSNPNFTVYVKPGEHFQHLGLDIFYKVCVPGYPNEIGRFKILPQIFSKKDYWHELRINQNQLSKSYHLVIDGEEQFASPENTRKITGTNFMLTTQGSFSWSFDCDPRKYASPVSSVTPWVVLVIIMFLIVFILATIAIYLKRSKQSSSVSVAERNASAPSSVVTRPTVFNTLTQGPAGGDPLDRVNSDEHLYEEMNDIIVYQPRPQHSVSEVPPSNSLPQQQQQQRESAFSTINSIYSGVGKRAGASNL